MIEKRESDAYKDVLLEVFQKKDYDYSGFDDLKKNLLDKEDTLFKIDWNNIEQYMEVPFRHDVET